MSDRAKVLWGITAFYVFGLIVLAVIFGISTHMNHEFLPQNEFKLVNWVDLGVFSINRAVLYLIIEGWRERGKSPDVAPASESK